jgi:hypothetical protein
MPIMADSLHWYPLKAEERLAQTAHLSIAARAGFDWLRAHAWLSAQHGEPPCSLPDDDKQLARLSGLGPKWPSVRAELNPFYRSVDGRLIDHQLLAIWEKQLLQHQRRSAAGQKGGRPRKAGETRGKARLKQRESESEVKRTPSGVTLYPLRNRTLHLQPPVTPGDRSEDETVDKAQRQQQIAGWEARNREGASGLREAAMKSIGAPPGATGANRIVQSLYEEMVMERVKVEQLPTTATANLHQAELPFGEPTLAQARHG